MGAIVLLDLKHSERKMVSSVADSLEDAHSAPGPAGVGLNGCPPVEPGSGGGRRREGAGEGGVCRSSQENTRTEAIINHERRVLEAVAFPTPTTLPLRVFVRVS